MKTIRRTKPEMMDDSTITTETDRSASVQIEDIGLDLQMRNWNESLIQYFLEGAKQNALSMLGVEVEHFILDRKNKKAVPYSGEKGIRRVLSALMASYPDADILPDDDFFGFSVPEFTVTLEPAAQLEISIAPMVEVRQIGEIYLGFYQTLHAVLAEFGYAAINTGCQPVSRVADLEMIPKRRYDLMDAYFRGFGTGGTEMMRGTASLQISIDYQSETDFRNKIQAAYYYGPIFKLFCDCSPSFQGEPLKTNLKRTDIWRRVDATRCGILPGVFSDSYGFEDYADFLGAMAPIFLKKGQHVLPTGNQTVAKLFDGKELSRAEISHIISMAFPDVRLKRFLEIRFADSIPFPFIPAYCALIKGLLYSDEGLAYAKEQIAGNHFSERDVLQAENELMKHGWQASIYGCPVIELAKQVLAMARRNLPDEEELYLNAFDLVAKYGGIREIPAEKYRALWNEVEVGMEITI